MEGRAKIPRDVPALVMLALLGTASSLLSGQVLVGRTVAAQSGAGLGIQIVNGTPGGPAASALPLTVYQVDGSQQQVVGQGRTDVRGTYTWPALNGPLSVRYVISTTYEGAAYHTEPVALPAPAVPLRVYEATNDDAALRISTAGMVITSVDAATQRIQVLETLTLHNGGVRTFLPSTSGPRGPMGLLRFGLPDGAGNLTPDGQLAASNIIQVNTGFATDLPVPPGDTTLSYTYELAYGALDDSGYALISKTVPYAVDSMRILVPQAAYSVQSPQLAAAGTVTLGSRTYRLLQGAQVPPNSEVALELRDLPLILPVLRSSNPWLQIGVGLLVLLAFGLPMFYRRWYLRRTAQ